MLLFGQYQPLVGYLGRRCHALGVMLILSASAIHPVKILYDNMSDIVEYTLEQGRAQR
ncbi:hypothetical protein [Parasphingorhabdus sp.]|uniref:hypothetical protein n=1 Tax=Parasphingorhabdus sp. TaxID=2709688 RepID=UPI0030038BBB